MQSPWKGNSNKQLNSKTDPSDAVKRPRFFYSLVVNLHVTPYVVLSLLNSQLAYEKHVY